MYACHKAMTPIDTIRLWFKDQGIKHHSSDDQSIVVRRNHSANIFDNVIVNLRDAPTISCYSSIEALSSLMHFRATNKITLTLHDPDFFNKLKTTLRELGAKT